MFIPICSSPPRGMIFNFPRYFFSNSTFRHCLHLNIPIIHHLTEHFLTWLPVPRHLPPSHNPLPDPSPQKSLSGLGVSFIIHGVCYQQIICTVHSGLLFYIEFHCFFLHLSQNLILSIMILPSCFFILIRKIVQIPPAE